MATYFAFQEAINQRALRRERVYRDRNDPLDSFTDIELISRYRFDRASISNLICLVKDDIERPTERSHALPAHIQVHIRFLAKGEYQSECGDLHGVSRASASRSISAFCGAICHRLDNINFPSIHDIRKTKEKFYRIAQLPNVLGAIDGTLIPIQGMSGPDEPLYICRKGFHAINVQAVVDADMKFLNINCKYPGSTHDAFILMNSSVADIVPHLPEGGWLIGDSGYPLKTWLITPLLSPSTPQERRYNGSLGKTRVGVERAFGVLKSRFRCLHKTGGALPYKPLASAKIMETCFRLHNKAVNERMPLTEGVDAVHIFNDHQCRTIPADDATRLRKRLISRF